MTDGPFKFSEELDDLVCDVLREHGPDGHVDGHDEMARAMVEFFNAHYRELHPPVSEEIKFTARDLLGDADEYIGKSPEYLKMHVLMAEMHSRKANAKLSRILAQGVRVYGNGPMSKPEFTLSDLYDWSEYECDTDTYTGIVVNIEEIKKGDE